MDRDDIFAIIKNLWKLLTTYQLKRSGTSETINQSLPGKNSVCTVIRMCSKIYA